MTTISSIMAHQGGWSAWGPLSVSKGRGGNMIRIILSRPYIGDGDSKAFISVKGTSACDNGIEVEKLKCTGHIQKCIDKALVNTVDSNRFLTSSDRWNSLKLHRSIGPFGRNIRELPTHVGAPKAPNGLTQDGKGKNSIKSSGKIPLLHPEKTGCWNPIIIITFKKCGSVSIPMFSRIRIQNDYRHGPSNEKLCRMSISKIPLHLRGNK